MAGGLGPKEGEERKRVAPRMYDDAHKAVYVVVSASKPQEDHQQWRQENGVDVKWGYIKKDVGREMGTEQEGRRRKEKDDNHVV